MKVNATNRVVQELKRLNEYRSASSSVNNWLAYCTNEASVIPANQELKRRNAEYDQPQNFQLKENEALLYRMLKEQLGYCMGEYGGAVRDVFLKQIGRNMRVFYPEEFYRNPYISKIQLKPAVCGRFMLTYSDFDAFELFDYNTAIQNNDLCVDIPRIGCFAEEIKFPLVVEKSAYTEIVWMSVTPNEICTMEKPIEHARGKVLTLGCGMGYFAYMASLKEEVSSVTIVECERDVIDLFESYILPQFEHREKINVVKGNAVEYLRNVKDGEFDYCFADIWTSANDLEPYFAVKEIGRNFDKTKIEYWIEDAIAGYLAGYVWPEIIDSFIISNGGQLPYPSQVKMAIIGDRGARYIKRLLKNEEISQAQHIHYYMNPENIISMIDKTDILF